MKIREIFESASAGATSAGMGASLPMGGSGSKVGTLFGGSYQQKSPKKKGQKSAKESFLKR